MSFFSPRSFKRLRGVSAGGVGGWGGVGGGGVAEMLDGEENE